MLSLPTDLPGATLLSQDSRSTPSGPWPPRPSENSDTAHTRSPAPISVRATVTGRTRTGRLGCVASQVRVLLLRVQLRVHKTTVGVIVQLKQPPRHIRNF